MKVLELFPTVIAKEINPKHTLIKKDIIKECLFLKDSNIKGGSNWIADTYNTCGTHDINDNKKFKILNDWVLDQIRKYMLTIGLANKKINSFQGWVNIYKKNNYQETHDHNGNDISVIYYLQTPKNSGNVRFYSPEPNGVKNCFDSTNPYTFKNYFIEPKEGQLLIFKSNLKHSVDQNKSNKTRISLAYNVRLK
tara:strand:- start:6 stop:587 length:582 start_codon:yes stop_codon:yes gene_type:complete